LQKKKKNTAAPHSILHAFWTLKHTSVTSANAIINEFVIICSADLGHLLQSAPAPAPGNKRECAG